MKTNLRIGEVLMERGCITQEQMEQALAYQKEHREKRVGQILIELGFVTESQVLEALAARLGLEIVSIGQMQVDLTAVRMIPRELAEKQNLLAVGFADKSLEVVTNDPLNYFAFEEVRQLTGCHVVIRLSELGSLQSAIRYYYAEVGAQQAAQTANEGFAGSDAELVHIEESESGDPEAPIVKLLSSLLDRAVSTGASDIHIEPFEGKTRVRMRIDGTIVDYVTLERSVHQPLIARIKIMANLDIAERRLPQDGHFRIRAGQEGHVNIRVSLLPTVFGEKAVLRILAAAAHVDHAEHFGMDDDSYARFLPMLNSPNGIIYLTGPTGSGKSTLMNVLGCLDIPTRGTYRLDGVDVHPDDLYEYYRKTGQEIKIEELAKMLGTTKEEVALSLEAFQPVYSIDEQQGDEESDGLSLLDKMSNHIDEANVLTNKLCIQQAINNLKDNEKQIIFLRYYKGKTQTEIAKIMGITQVQVSRIEKRVLENMRVKLAI